MTRVRLMSIGDPNSVVKPGDEGKVISESIVGWTGTKETRLVVDWDNGSVVALYSWADVWEIVSEESEKN